MDQIPDRKNILFCFCGPTASGKSSICRDLVTRDNALVLSCSTTTRKPRVGEREGIDYFFVDEEEFDKRVNNGLFLEHAVFSGHRYGTEKQKVETAFQGGKDILFDIEVNGVMSLKKLFPGLVVTIFVFPPSMEDLKVRLRQRNAESKEEMDLRLETARKEIEQLLAPDFSDYFVLNSKLDESSALSHKIILSERHRLSRYRKEFLTTMFGTRMS